MATESEFIASFIDHTLIDVTPIVATHPAARPHTPPPRCTMFDVLMCSPVSEDCVNTTLAPSMDPLSDHNISMTSYRPLDVCAGFTTDATPGINGPYSGYTTVNPKSLRAVSSDTSLCSFSGQSNELDVTEDEDGDDGDSVSSLNDDCNYAFDVPRHYASDMPLHFDWKVNDALNEAFAAWIKKNEIAKKRREARAKALAAAIAAEEDRFNAAALEAELKAKAKARQDALKKIESEKQLARDAVPPTSSIPVATHSNSKSSSSTTVSSSRSNQLKRRKSEPAIQTVACPSKTPSSSKRRRSSSMSSASPKKSSSKRGAPVRRYTEEEKPFKCNKCVKSFRRQEHLKRHYRSIHSKDRPYPCLHCDKMFSRSDNLSQHIKTHHYNIRRSR